MRIFSYRNLNRKGVVWSVKDCKSNRVIDRAHEVYFEDVDLKVSQAGRERVIKEQRKNVHAGVKGTRLFAVKNNLVWQKASYNPYKNQSFVLEDGSPVHHAKFAKLTEQGLFISL
jgi:hypothetical protein